MFQEFQQLLSYIDEELGGPEAEEVPPPRFLEMARSAWNSVYAECREWFATGMELRTAPLG